MLLDKNIAFAILSEDQTKTIVILYRNGDVAFGEGITPTEAALKFWNAIGEIARRPAMEVPDAE